MPFQKGTTPPRLKGKGIPQHFINIFIEAFDAALKSYKGDEGTAYRVGYSAMRKALKKAGWKRTNGRWVKEDMDAYDLDGNPETLTDVWSKGLTILEEGASGDVLRVKGVALVDGVISQGGAGRYYTEEFNTRAMNNTNVHMEAGNVVTMYSRHGRAVAPKGQLPTGLPVGKVDRPLYREGNKIMYEACIVPTAEGRDVQMLIRNGVMLATSIRSSKYRAIPRKMNGVVVEEMVDAVIQGIDLAEEPGIAEAGIVRILEEAPVWDPEQEEQDMEWDEMTLEELVAKRPDLLEEYAATKLEATTARITELEAQVAAQNPALEERVATLTAQVEQDKLTLAIAQAGVGVMSVSRMIVEELTASAKTVEDVAKLLPAARTHAMVTILSASPKSGADSAKGKTALESTEEGNAADEEEGDDDEAPLTEEQEKILHIAG